MACVKAWRAQIAPICIRRGKAFRTSAAMLSPLPHSTRAAWKEDFRRLDNGRAFNRVIRLAMASGVSRTWKGYWQRHQ